MSWQEQYRDKLVTAEKAVALVKSGDKVVFSMMQQPKRLGWELSKRKDQLKNVTLLSHWDDDYPWFQSGWEDSFTVKAGFIMGPTKQAVKERRVDWVPNIFGLNDALRQTEPYRISLFHYADVFYVRVSPPDESGYCSLGPVPWFSPTSLRTAKIVIAEVDPDIVRVFGESIHISEIDYLVEAEPVAAETKLVHGIRTPLSYEQGAIDVIGANIASLLRDGDNLEVGVGNPSEAVLRFLEDKKDLGIDGEMVYLQMIDLMKKGIITGKQKNINKEKVVCVALLSYAEDPRMIEALEFVRENPVFEFRDSSYICNIPRIASNDNMVAINSAVTIDLLGQLVIDHVGTVPISGPGGQVEYCIGSHYSKGGRSITAMTSTTKQGTVSRIVPQLEAGTVIEIPLTYVDYLVTEYGIANLEGKSRRERSEAIISVAHPDYRPKLRDAARKLFWP